jgi:hypothetical protein
MTTHSQKSSTQEFITFIMLRNLILCNWRIPQLAILGTVPGRIEIWIFVDGKRRDLLEGRIISHESISLNWNLQKATLFSIEKINIIIFFRKLGQDLQIRFWNLTNLPGFWSLFYNNVYVVGTRFVENIFYHFVPRVLNFSLFQNIDNFIKFKKLTIEYFVL